mgnify:CR=1 FL=1
MSSLNTAAKLLFEAARKLAEGTDWLIQVCLAIVIVLLLIRFLVDKFNLNPFGRLAYYARRPTNQWFYEVRNSQFYQPLRQMFGFDPAWLLLLIGFALLFYLLRGLVLDVVILLQCLSITLSHFGNDKLWLGGRGIIGMVLLTFIYFLMALMTLLVIYSWFGLFGRAAEWAGRRIYPIIYSFDPTGRLGPLVFLLGFFLLGFVAAAVQAAFF